MQQKTDAFADIQYKNYISLGYFCEVAGDLEKLGLRNQSSPFDWTISCFPNVLEAIDKEFDGFMKYDNLYQNIQDRRHYYDRAYNIYFFHDFSQYKSLDEQYGDVKEKYDRRIRRFLHSVKSPTLFVRYISAEEADENGRSSELNYIEENYERVQNSIKRFNKENNIIFIGDESLKSDVIRIYPVRRDENDTVSRQPILNNKELFPILSSVNFPGKEENIQRYNKKTEKNGSLSAVLNKKIRQLSQKTFLKEYRHSRTYDLVGK